MFEQELIDKLYSRVVKQENGCWTYHRSIGYKAKVITVFRIAYYAKYQANNIPKKVYRTCDNMQCINPEHICKDENEYIKYMLNNPNNYELIWNETYWDYCHVWTRHQLNNGYPKFSINGKFQGLHRLVLKLDNIDMTDKVARHKCHNRACVKPSHLTYGTIADNIQDTVDINRHAKGSTVGTSKYTEAQVLEAIKLLKTTTKTLRQIAKQVNMTVSALQNISNGVSWRHLHNMPINSKRVDWYETSEIKQLSLFELFE